MWPSQLALMIYRLGFIQKGLKEKEGDEVIDRTDTDDRLFAMTLTSFEDKRLALPASLLRGLATIKFLQPSKIQSAALLKIRAGHNLLAQSHNNTGKTACIVLAMLTVVSGKKVPQALCICPTRELAHHIGDEVLKMGKYMVVEAGVHIRVIVRDERFEKGAKMEEQVVIGTPGVVWALIKKRVLGTAEMRIFMLDDADMISASPSLGDASKRIQQKLPKNVQTLFFSATWTEPVANFAKQLSAFSGNAWSQIELQRAAPPPAVHPASSPTWSFLATLPMVSDMTMLIPMAVAVAIVAAALCAVGLLPAVILFLVLGALCSYVWLHDKRLETQANLSKKAESELQQLMEDPLEVDLVVLDLALERAKGAGVSAPFLARATNWRNTTKDKQKQRDEELDQKRQQRDKELNKLKELESDGIPASKYAVEKMRQALHRAEKMELSDTDEYARVKTNLESKQKQLDDNTLLEEATLRLSKASDPPAMHVQISGLRQEIEKARSAGVPDDKIAKAEAKLDDATTRQRECDQLLYEIEALTKQPLSQVPIAQLDRKISALQEFGVLEDRISTKSTLPSESISRSDRAAVALKVLDLAEGQHRKAIDELKAAVTETKTDDPSRERLAKAMQDALSTGVDEKAPEYKAADSRLKTLDQDLMRHRDAQDQQRAKAKENLLARMAQPPLHVSLPAFDSALKEARRTEVADHLIAEATDKLDKANAKQQQHRKAIDELKAAVAEVKTDDHSRERLVKAMQDALSAGVVEKAPEYKAADSRFKTLDQDLMRHRNVHARLRSLLNRPVLELNQMDRGDFLAEMCKAISEAKACGSSAAVQEAEAHLERIKLMISTDAENLRQEKASVANRALRNACTMESTTHVESVLATAESVPGVDQELVCYARARLSQLQNEQRLAEDRKQKAEQESERIRDWVETHSSCPPPDVRILPPYVRFQFLDRGEWQDVKGDEATNALRQLLTGEAGKVYYQVGQEQYEASISTEKMMQVNRRSQQRREVRVHKSALEAAILSKGGQEELQRLETKEQQVVMIRAAVGVQYPGTWHMSGKDSPRHVAGAAGFAVFPVPTAQFDQLLSVPDPEELGRGRDVRNGDLWTGKFPKSLRLVQAWRVQNLQLWQQYSAARSAVQTQVDQLRKKGVPVRTLRTELHPKMQGMPPEEIVDQGINEVFLLHGTTPETLVSILANGLSDKFSGGLFGQGIYFAENACKNDQYVTKDDHYQGHGGLLKDLHRQLYGHSIKHPNKPVYYLVLCRVVMGVPVFTKDGETDEKSQSIWSNRHRELSTIDGTMFHHSLVVQAGPSAQYELRRHREFLQYHQNRTYPAYILAYHRLIDRGHHHEAV